MFNDTSIPAAEQVVLSTIRATINVAFTHQEQSRRPLTIRSWVDDKCVPMLRPEWREGGLTRTRRTTCCWCTGRGRNWNFYHLTAALEELSSLVVAVPVTKNQNDHLSTKKLNLLVRSSTNVVFARLEQGLAICISCSYQKVHTFRCNVRWKNLNCALQGPWATSVDKIIVDMLFLCIYRQTKLLWKSRHAYIMPLPRF